MNFVEKKDTIIQQTVACKCCFMEEELTGPVWYTVCYAHLFLYGWCHLHLLQTITGELGICLRSSPLDSLTITDMQLRIAFLLLTLGNKQYIKHIDDFKIHISEVEHSSLA